MHQVMRTAKLNTNLNTMSSAWNETKLTYPIFNYIKLMLNLLTSITFSELHFLTYPIFNYIKLNLLTLLIEAYFKHYHISPITCGCCASPDAWQLTYHLSLTAHYLSHITFHLRVSASQLNWIPTETLDYTTRSQAILIWTKLNLRVSASQSSADKTMGGL